jgi:hypothetical protein
VQGNLEKRSDVSSLYRIFLLAIASQARHL